MKTQRLKLNNETRQLQAESLTASIPIDSDEKILCTEDKVRIEGTTLESALPLFLILGSPLHAIVGFAAITAFISEKSLAQFWSEMNGPIIFMAILLVVCIALAKSLPATR
jgi:hypothetical protein